MLNYGQNPDTPVIPSLRSRIRAVNQFIGRWSEQLSAAKESIRIAQQRQKKYADQHRRSAPIFKPGDEVLLSIKQVQIKGGCKAKLAPRYIGPLKVLPNIGPSNLAYRIELPSPLQRMHNVFHVPALKPYNRNRTYHPPPLPEVIDGELEWEVDWIEATRFEGSRRQYLVHWTGYQKPGWEPVSNLTSCPQNLKEFWNSKQMACPHPIHPSYLPILLGDHEFVAFKLPRTRSFPRGGNGVTTITSFLIALYRLNDWFLILSGMKGVLPYLWRLMLSRACT
jgi:hypothetical protein